MKPRLFTSILLFISAYSPLFLMLSVNDFDFDGFRNFKHPIAIYIMLAASALSVILLLLIVKKMKRGNMPIKIIKVKNRSIDLISYTIPYIIPFLGFDLSKTENILSLAIFLLLLCLLTIRSKAVFMNPILLIIGYNLYDLEYEYDCKIHETIVLSKYDMKSEEIYYIKNLTRFIYLITQKEEIQNEEPSSFNEDAFA